MSLLDWSRPPSFTILFKEAYPPRPEPLLEGLQANITPGVGPAWTAEITHCHGCGVIIEHAQDPSCDVSSQTRFSWGLTDDEKQSIQSARSGLVVTIDPGQGPVLQTRKRALGALRAVMNNHALAAMSEHSFRVWSPTAIDEELMTDADLDVEAMYAIHAVTADDQSAYWIHSHGLGALGGFDVDLLRPCPNARHGAATIIRALAYFIIDEQIVVDQPAFPLTMPGGVVRLVQAAEFDREADEQWSSLRDLRNPEHVENRAVVCEPEPERKRSLLKRRPPRPEPSRWIRETAPEHFAVNFGRFASKCMSKRARETFPLLRQVAAEFADLGLPILAKIGYPTDSGDSDEHLWFEVHAVHEDALDATLINQPYHVSALKQGDRARHPAGQLTEWQIQTPVGSISPSHFAPIRTIRDHRPEIERIMREHRGD